MSEPKNVKPAKQETLDPVVEKMKRAFPKAQMHEIRLDRSLGGEKKSVFVGVNGYKYQVPTGKWLKVPTPIYEALQRMEANMEKLEDVRSEIPNEF